MRFYDLGSALDELESRAREVAKAAPNKALDVRYRSYEPIQQVFARVELAGPQRLLPSVRAGVDVRGDGSVQAFRGHVKRERIVPRRGEGPYTALRRALEAPS
jgi:hypothetical protein